jgi:hypothetical protein
VTTLPGPLAAIAVDLEAARARLIEALRSLDDTQTVRSPSPGEWNAAQVVDHLLLAEGFTNDLTLMMVDKARTDGEATGFPADLEAFDALPPPISMEAPPPIRPRQELPARELACALEDMARRTSDSFSALSEVDPRRYKFEHPLFGDLDLGQWWTIHPIHYEMHIAQAQRALGQGT